MRLKRSGTAGGAPTVIESPRLVTTVPRSAFGAG